MNIEPKYRKVITIWLTLCCLLTLTIVTVGGITRLTKSGLSIVEWAPVKGTLYPTTEAAWQEEFEKYKKFPEYQTRNKGMSLEDFKFIYFWEWFHRFLGRLIGAVFFIPFVIFLFLNWFGKESGPRKFSFLMLLLALQASLFAFAYGITNVPNWLKILALPISLLVTYFAIYRSTEIEGMRRFGFMFILGGMQGIIGWYMVQSGLVKDPSVSHYRLATHLSMAFFLFVFMFYSILDMYHAHDREPQHRRPKDEAMVRNFFILVAIQIIYGAFVAGLKAGFMYNTFPLMNGVILPNEAFNQGMLSFFENGAMVQFIHRILGIVCFGYAIYVHIRLLKNRETFKQTFFVMALPTVTLIQFFLGLFTLLYVVPISLAIIHQAVALLLLAITAGLYHSLRKTSGQQG